MGGVDSSDDHGEITTDYAVQPLARSIDYLGGTYRFGEDLSVTLYGSELEDIWRQYYANAGHRLALPHSQALTFVFHLYDVHDHGKSKGEISTTPPGR